MSLTYCTYLCHSDSQSTVGSTAHPHRHIEFLAILFYNFAVAVVVDITLDSIREEE